MNMGEKLINVQYFDAIEACRRSKLSRTMLDYLTREGLIVPSGTPKRSRGKKRLYSFGDVVTLRVIAKLLKSGIEVRRLRRALKRFRTKISKCEPGKIPFRFLISDGTEVFFENEGTIESLTQNGQLAFVFLIDMKKCEAEITELEPGRRLRAKASNG